MKKTLLLTLVILASSLAQAEISGNCKNSMKKVAVGYHETLEAIKTGDITSETAQVLLGGWEDAARSTALGCVGIMQINMERSLRGRMGLISDNEVERKSAQTYEEAMSYYNSLITK
ncbi:hypothetical protein [Bdellovibrio svalbardensis]|uniref:Uncharacterized protein n=1 Tax=Bdellovibrio svalbardensis TaxID=2972972 RepID=A0ABT6DDI8_9BACT|nr:hypothetical protein [Bdellovibrio svalbardensis]MDG0814905.1 hypothetical protein [Bdellovibrio svalbardensis]